MAFGICGIGGNSQQTQFCPRGSSAVAPFLNLGTSRSTIGIKCPYRRFDQRFFQHRVQQVGREGAGVRAGVQRVQDLLGIFEARAHDLAGNGVIVVVAAGAGDDGIGVNGACFPCG